MRLNTTISKALLMIIVFSLYASSLYSQGNTVTIRLHQPPPNQLNISNLWKATLTNNTKAPIKIYLEGYAEEEKGGRIVEGKTEVFILPLGKKDYKYEDFKTGTVNWINKKYEEPIIRTGTAPSGTYTICMTAKNEQGEIVGMENCITHIVDIKTEGIITLISPSDNEKISDANPLFMWSPPMPAPSGRVEYSVRIVELIKNQSPEEAIRNNSSFFEKREILTTQYQYSSSNQKLQSGKKYAWQIICNGTKSDVFIFTLGPEQEYKIFIDSIRCIQTQNSSNWLYRIKFKVKNDHPSLGLRLTAVELYSPTGSSCPSGTITGSLLPPTGQIIIGSISPNILTTTIPSGQPQDFILIADKGATNDTYFNIRFMHEFVGGGFGGDCDSIKIPPCSCCEDFSVKFEKLEFEKVQKPLSYVLSGGISVGNNVLIKEVTMEIAYFDLIPSDNTCIKCVNNSNNWGNITGASLTGFSKTVQIYPKPGYPREVILNSSNGVIIQNKEFAIGLSLPEEFSYINCCSDIIRFCIKFYFTDKDCQTCEYTICKKYQRKNGVLTELKEKPSLENEKQEKDEGLDGKGQGNRSLFIISDNVKDTLKEFNEELAIKKAIDIGIEKEELPGFINGERAEFMNKQLVRENPSLEYIMADISSNPCENADFESGDFTGWAGATSIRNTGFPPDFGTWVSGFVTLRHTITTVGTDPLVPIISTVHNGNHALRLGNSNRCREAELISKTFTVDISNANYTFWYALVFQRYIGHNNTTHPLFWVRVKNVSGNVIPGLEFGPIIAEDPVINPFFQIGPNAPPASIPPCQTNSGSTQVIYRNWTSGSIDLSTQVGNQVTVEFIISDCSTGGDFGYVYLDDVCGTSGDDNEGTVNLSTISSGCNELPIQVCGNITLPQPQLPWTATLQSISLNIYQNSSQVGATISNPVITGSNFCFTLISSNFPTVPPDGFDFVATAVFSLSNGSTTTTITKRSSTNGNGVTLGSNNDYLVNCPQGDCCSDFVFKLNPKDWYLKPIIVGNNNTEWELHENISVTSHKIKKMTASIVYANFKTNPDCINRCFNIAREYINFIPKCSYNNGSINVPGKFVVPTNGEKMSRNVYWGSYSSVPVDINNYKVDFRLKFPPISNIKCCADTITFCIRYRFLREDCITCDTLMCYKVVQRGDGTYDSKILSFDGKVWTNVFFKDRNDPYWNFANDSRLKLLNQGKGASTKLEIELNEKSNVDFSLTDIDGKTIKSILNEKMEKGNYAFELSDLNLPDGEYFIKYSNGELSKKRRVIIENTVEDCNCGKK